MPHASTGSEGDAAATASVVVCVYNRAGQVGGCLESLRAQTHAGAELILVNDGSSDHTAAVLDAFRDAHPDHRIVVVHNPRNLGLSAARNAGIAAATGEFVFFTDSDCTAEPQWLAEMLRPFADPAVAAVAGVALDHPPRNYAERAYVGTTRIGMTASQGRHLVGNNMGFRKAVLDEFGFDPAMSYYCDEDELAWRLRSAGHRIGFAANAVVHHDHPFTTRKYLRLAWLQGQGSARLWYKQGKYIGRDVLPATLGLLTLPLGFVSAWLLLVPAFFFAAQLAALVFNQWKLKGKPLVTAVALLPIEVVYSAVKSASVFRTLLRILLGLEPKIRESKRRWLASRAASVSSTASAETAS
jgi:glycosyltransferase involved in cell wall biosynthesis